jgi:hypothetical protein
MSLTFFSSLLSFDSITEEENTYGYFMQDGATANTDTYSINVLNEVFENRLISRGLWPARSPDFNPCDIYLWGNLKDKVYSNNPHTLVELKQSIREAISSVEVSELKLVSNNISKRLEACLRAEGRHFEHLCDGESLKLCIYFQKCTYVFTVHGISSARRQKFFSADDAGVSHAEADGKSQASASFAEFPVERFPEYLGETLIRSTHKTTWSQLRRPQATYNSRVNIKSYIELNTDHFCIKRDALKLPGNELLYMTRKCYTFLYFVKLLHCCNCFVTKCNSPFNFEEPFSEYLKYVLCYV